MEEKPDQKTKPSTNHRYLSREEILIKLDDTRKRVFSEKSTRERIEEEMLEMEEEDHFDLLKIIEKIPKRDVPEDLSIIWDQQQKILQTVSKNRYRWHPR